VTSRSAQHSLVPADDGIIDPIAIEIAARRTRTVALPPWSGNSLPPGSWPGAARPTSSRSGCTSTDHRPHARGPMPGRDVMTQRAGAQHDTGGVAR
jgi:hypothetical protein